MADQWRNEKEHMDEKKREGSDTVERRVIKPCPFCGSEPTVEKLTISPKIFICCHTCKISQYNYRKEEDAIEAWNRRAL